MKITAEIGEQLISKYASGLSTVKLAEEFNIGAESIRKYLIKKGTLMRKYRPYTKYSFDESFFSVIDTEEKAYWLGFITADGCIYKNTLVICLSSVDALHLEKIRLDLKTLKPLYYSKEKVYLQIRSKQMTEDLARMNIVPRKTRLIKELPNIDSSLIRHFIRGVFDGDGSITSDFTGRHKSPCFRFSIYGNQSFLYHIQQILIKECCITPTKINVGTRTWYYRKSGNKQLKTVYHYLYSSSNIYLERKENTFKQVLIDPSFGNKRSKSAQLLELPKALITTT